MLEAGQVFREPGTQPGKVSLKHKWRGVVQGPEGHAYTGCILTTTQSGSFVSSRVSNVETEAHRRGGTG